MNKIFKVIWSKSKQCYVVVSEIAKNKTGKKKIVVAGIFAALAMVNGGQATFAAWPAGGEGAQSAFWMGRSSSATGQNAQAIGVAANASSAKSVAIGSDSFAQGVPSGGEANAATAVGAHSNATGPGASAFGFKAIANAGNATAIGTDANVSGQYSVGVGWKSKVTVDNSIAIGEQAKALKEGSSVMGPDARGYGNGSLSIGYQALAGANVFTGAANNPSPYNDTPATINNYALWGDAAIGLRAVATGGNATALGRSARAAAANAIAIGGGNGNSATDNTDKTEATGEKATAIGYNAKAVTGNDTAIGAGVTASGGASTMIGYSSTVTGNQAFGGGSGLSVAGGGSVGLGYNSSTTSDKSIAIGHTTKATQANTVAIGASATAAGLNSIAMGNSASITAPTAGTTLGGQDSIAIGSSASAQQHSSISVGFGASSNGVRSVAIGPKASATDEDTIAIGSGGVNADKNNQATGANGDSYNSTVAGLSVTNLYYGAKSVDKQSIAIGYTANAKESGIAFGNNAVSDGGGGTAMGKSVLSRNGGLVVGQSSYATGKNSVAYGNTARASGETSTAVGYSTTADGQNAVAVGYSNTASNKDSVAIGNTNQSTNQGSVTVGYGNNATNDNAVAIGRSTNASGLLSTAIGNGAASQGTYDVAIGSDVTANGNNSVAIGRNAKTSNTSSLAIGVYGTKGTSATGAYSIAMGRDVTASAESAIAIGKDAVSDKKNAVAIGSGTDTSSVATAQSSATIAGKSYSWSKGVLSGADLAGMQVSVGKSGAERQIKNVAAGEVSANSTDAINGSQLYAVASGLAKDLKVPYVSINSSATGANSNFDNDGAKGANSIAIGPSSTVTKQNSIAFGNNAQSLSDDSIAIGRNAKAESGSVFTNTSRAIAIGSNSRVATNVVQGIAIGSGTKADEGAVVTGDQSIAIGGNVKVDGHGAVGIGGDDAQKAGSMPVTYTNTDNVEVTGTLRSAILNLTGYDLSKFKGTTASHAGVAYGTSALAGNAGVAIGTASDSMTRKDDKGQVVDDKPVTNAVAIGTGARANFDNSVAIGGGSNTDHYATKQVSAIIDGVEVKWSGGDNIAPGDVVSFGANGFERQLKNVAPGEVSQTSTDAVNGSQIYSLARKVTNIMNGGSGSVVNVNSLGQPLSKVVTTENGNKVEKYYRTSDIREDGTVPTGTQEQTPTSLALVNVAQPNVNLRTTTPQILGNVANGVNDNDAVNVSQLKAATVKYFSVNSTVGDNRNNDKATGTNAIAVGPAAQAAGNNTVSVGYAAGYQASGKNNVGIGTDAGRKLSGDNNISIGSSSGNNSVNSDQTKTTTYTNNSVMLGNEAKVIDSSAQNSIDNVVVIGNRATSSGTSSVVLGTSASSTDKNTIAIGNSSKATSISAVALGNTANATGLNAMALGLNTKASDENSVAIGNTANASAKNTLAMGTNTKASSEAAIALGTNAESSGFGSIAIGEKSKAQPTTAISPAGSVAIGYRTESTGDFAVALGSGNGSYTGASANGVGTVAVGTATVTASGRNFQTVVGFGATTNNENAAAFGHEAKAYAEKSLALGTGSSATVIGGVALGSGSVANTDKNKQGFDQKTGRTDTYAGLKDEAFTSTAGAVSVGDVANKVTRQITGVAAGTNDTDAVNVAQLKSVNLAFTGNTGNGGDVNLSQSKLALNGDNQYITTKADGKTLTISGKKQEITVSNGVASASSGMADASNVAQAITQAVSDAKYNWKLSANGQSSTETIAKGDTVDFSGDNNITVSRTGKNISTKLNDTITVDSVNAKKKVTVGTGANQIALDGTLGVATVGASGPNQIIMNGSSGIIQGNKFIGNSFKAGKSSIDNDGLTITNGPSVLATGINAGNKQITGVSSGGTIDTNAANIGDVKKAVANVSQNLNISDGTKDSSVALKSQKLTVTGTGAATTTVNNQTITVDVAEGTLSNNADGTVKADAAGVATTKNVADVINKTISDNQYSWKLSANGEATTATVGKGDTVDFTGDTNITVDRNNKDISVKLNKNLTEMNSISLGNARGETIVLNGGDGSIKAGKAEFKDNVGAGSTITSDQLKFTNGATGANESTTTIALDTVSIQSGPNSSALTSKYLTFSDKDGNNAEGSAKGVVFQNAAGKLVQFTVDEITAGGNKIQEVAEGTADTDAVNVKQLKDTIGGQSLTYRANTSADTDAKSVKLSKGLDFVNGTSTVASVDEDGKVSFDLNTVTKTQINTNTTNIATNTANIAHTIALADDAGVSTTAKSLKDGNVSFNIKGDNKFISTAASGNDVTLTVNEQAIKDAAKNASSFKVKANTHAEEEVKGGDTITFNNGDNIAISQTGKTFTIGTAKNITVDSVTAGNTVINTSGLTNGTTAITGTGVTTDKVTVGGISIDKTAGINAGGKVISNVASGTVNNNATDDSNAANIGDVKQAVANLSQNLNITDGTNNGTVDLKNQKLNVAGANGVTATVNNQTITVGLDANTVNATTKGIGLTGDTGSTGNKYLKDGDVSFAVTGDGNLVSTTATTAGVKVAVDAAKVKDLAVAAVTVSKDAQADNPITVTPTAGANSKDYAIGIDTTKLAAKTDLTYRANSAADANAKKVSLSKGLDFVDGDSTVATVDNDGKVSFDLNTVTKNQINKNTADIATNKGKIATNTTNIAANTTALARNISLGADTGTVSSQSLSTADVAFNVKGATGDFVSTNMNGNTVEISTTRATINSNATTGEASVTGNDGLATAQNVADAINAAKKASKTEITANTGEAANATTGNVTLTSTTAADGHTIYDVKLNDKVTLGTGANAVTVDGTAAKVTAGVTTVDGATGTITTGGTNSIKVDGATGTVTGLTNKDWTPGVTKAVTGRAATEDQLQKVADAASSQTWNITADKAGTTGAQTGTKKNATVGKDETVELVAGDNLTINQDERKFTYSLNKDLAGLTSVSIGTGTTETIKLDGATGKITAKNAAIGGVTIDGDNNHVTGLANTTWNGTATTGRAATEDQLKAVAETAKTTTDAVNLKFSGNTNTSPGVVNLKDDTLGIVGDGKYVSTDANGKNLTVKVSEAEVKKSAVAAVTVSTDTTDANNPLTVTPTTSADGTTKDYKVTIDGTKIANKTNLSYKANGGTAKQVSLADGLNFKNGTLTTASIDDNGVVKYDVNTASITAGADGTITGPTTDGVATAKNVADAINAAKKASKTEITANTGEAANATTGNVTLTSTTAADGHTIYDVKLNDKVTLGSGANAVTIDGTAGKATIGTSIVDGANNTFTTGGASPVTLNGATGTITGTTANIGGVTVNGTANTIGGLSNTTWNGTATTGRAATEDQLKAVADAAGSQTWEITADKKAGTSGAQTGTKENAKVGKDDKVSLIAGENLTVDQVGKNFTYSLNTDLVKMNSATFLGTGTNTTVITGDSITQTAGTQTNTSTAAGNTVANGTKSTETTADGQVIKDGTKINTSTVDENTIVDGARSNKTTVDSNVIDDGNGNVNTSNATSNTITDGTNTSTITAGKATIGSSVIDGVNNTFTTGGANAVKLDGAAGIIKTGTVTVTGGTTNDITGLSNTTLSATDFATKGRAATEEQLKAATGATTLKFTGDVATNTGSVNLKDDTFGIKGDGKYISTDVNGKNVNLTVSEAEVKKSAVAAVTVSTDTTDANNPISVTPTTSADGTTKDYKVTIDGTKIANKTNLSYKANGGTAKQVSLADGLNFKNGTLTTASIDDNGVVKYDVNTASITAGADGTITGPTTDGVATAKNVADAINAAKKASKTEITANTGEAANATTGNVTLTSTTAADGHTIYDVKLNDKVTLGSGANAVTIDGTAGKATIGSSIVDGVNNTFTTGGASPVTLNGATGTITGKTANIGGVTVDGTNNHVMGLANKDWTPGVTQAVSGRAATEDQLQKVSDAVGAGWKVNTGKVTGSTGESNGAASTKVASGEEVQFQAGNNLVVDQNGKTVAYSLNKALKDLESATFNGTGTNKTVINGDSITQTAGTQTNTSTAGGNTVADGTKSTETTVDGQVIKDGAKSNKSTVDSNVIDDGNGKVNTSNATSNTITDGTNTTATTSSSVTVKDNAGNSTVITKDNITTGVGGNKITLDGTAGKATVGASVIDGVNNTFTTGGANAVKLDGTAGTIKTGTVIVTGGTTNDITGLSNTTVTATDFATKGRAATEEQLKAVGEQTWQITADKDATTSGAQTGTKKDAKVGKDDKVQLIAGENMTVNQNERDFTFTLNKDLVKMNSATFLGTGSNTTVITGNSITQTAGTQTNTSTAAGNTVADGTKSTETTAAGQVIKDGAKSNKSTVSSNVIDDGTGNVNTSNATSNTITDGTNTSTITAGKATIGSSIVDGVNNTFTTGGANAVKLDGAVGTIKTGTVTVTGGTTNDITGLSNTTVTAADFATKGRAATEEQLKAVGEQTWQITADKDATTSGDQTGTKKDAKVGKDDKVQLIAGENMTVNQNERDFTFTLNKDLVKMNSATFLGTGSNTTVITGNSITQTAGTQTNTSTAAGNTVADGTKSTETTAAGQVIKDGAKTNTSTVDENTLVDGAKSNKTTVDSNVIDDGTNTSTITAGKATIGSSIIDGVNNTFITGGASPVTLNGATGTITGKTANIGGVTVDGTNNHVMGLANKDWTPGVTQAVSGRAATEDQLQKVSDAVGAGWKVNTGKVTGSTGESNGAASTKVASGEEVQFQAGNNLIVDQNGKTVAYSLNKALKDLESATFNGTGTNKTVITGDSITQTAGTQTNTSTAGGNTVADGTKSTETTAAGQVIKDGTKTNTSTVDENTIVDGTKSNKSTVDGNTITDGTNTTVTTSSSVTVKDNAGNSTVITKDNITTGVGGNKIILDGTAGKATIGSSIVDGVNNTFTTGGANAVKLDGAAGTIKTGTVTVTGGTTNDITGLSNTTVTGADFATKGRAATEEQLKVVGEQTWQITADKNATTSGAQTGTKKDAKVGKDDKVQLIAGENMTVNQNERDFTFTLNKDLVKMNSATFEATGGKTTVIKGDSIVQTDGTKVNTSTAGGNTVVDGTKSTATIADGTTVTSANGNTKYAADGVRINTTGKNPVSLTDVGLDNGNNVIKNVASGHVNNDATDNTNAANIADVKKATTTVTANAGEAANATKGNVTLTSTTAADGHTIYDVKLNDKVTLGTGANVITIDGTAGKATVGSSVIDGVNNTFTTGGANAVKLDGAAGTIRTGTVTVTGGTTNDITGLSNTTVTSADFATKGRAATEEQLKAVGEQTWQITADKDATTSGAQTGTKKDAKVGKDDKVQLIAGENMTVNQNERDFTFTLNKDLVKMNSATFLGTGSNTTVITGNSITQTAGTQTNTSTAAGNTVADGTKSTETTAAGQVIKDGAKSNKSTVSSNVIDDGTGNVNTSNATSNTITDGTNTTATTSSSVTVKDNAGNSTVITKDNITTGVGGNKITLDGTAGKATVGASVVDGVNNTFTTGGANAVKLDGAAGTIKTGTVTVTGGTTNDITGLSNTTVTAADFATKGRAATEEQLKAVGEQTWQITADKDATTSGAQTGTKKDAKVGKDDKVQLIAGENMTVNQNERDFTFTLNKDLVKMNSATFEATGGKTTIIKGDSIVQTDGTKVNTSTAGGNTVANGTKSTETTADGQVIKDGAKSNKSTVSSNVIDDGTGNVNTSNATSNTITDGTNTTATTSSSVTVKDNAGNSTVITKDNITTGVGGNKITLDGTAGKATVGASVVDGVNNTFTTGGANAVKLDGAAGTIKTGTVTVTGGTTNDITGLSNTTVTAADFATKGRAATEEQLKAVGEQTWQITADKDATTSGAQTGTKKDAKVGKDDKVQLIAGENMTVNQNERDFTFTLNKDLVKMNSATFLGTGSNTTVITGNSITQTAGTQTNTSTAAGNTVADGTKSTETTAAGQVIKDGAKSNKSTVSSNVIDDGNGNVNTSNATSNTITDGTNTSTITAGKANIGNIAVDGVNNKITVGTGANPVTLDGANGHLDGLTNTTWVPGVTKATTGRAATEDQLQQVSDAVGAGWKVNTGTVAGSSGVSNGAASTKVSSGEEVKLQAGDNLVIDQNGKTVSYSLNKDLTKMNSATFEATGGKTTVIKGDSIVQIDGGKTNTSNAAGNTVVDGNKSTSTTAAGTTITDGAKTNTSTTDKNVINDGAGNTNTATATSNNLADNAGNSNVSNATSNTLKNAAGDETKADAKGVTVKDAAGNNATFTKDGITITKTGKDTVSLTSDGLDNGKNKIVNVAAGVANTDAVNVGQLKEYAAKSTTELTANNGETAGSTTGNIVLTKTTAADGHTIYDNKLNDKITLGTDPTKAVAVDGTTGTVTGLTNKTWTPGSIVSGRAATEDQLKEAVADSGWKAAVDKEGSGQSTVVGTSPEKIKAEETVTFKAGNNMMVTQTGKSISYAVNPELTNMTSATFKDAAGNTTVTNGNGITITPGSANPTNPHAGPVSLTKDGLNNGNNQIKGVAPGTDPTDAVNVSQLNASNANTSQAINQIAGEVQHVGAHAAAMAALKPIQYDPLEPTQVMAGVGNYRGETAAALGLAHYTNENTMFNVGVSVGGNHNMVNAGVTHKFGYSPEKKNIPDRYKAGPISSVYVMQDEVSSLKKENAEQKYVIADQAARLTTLEAENEQQRRELAETKKGLDDLKAAVDKLLASKG